MPADCDNMIATGGALVHAIRSNAIDIPLADPHFGRGRLCRAAQLCHDFGLT